MNEVDTHARIVWEYMLLHQDIGSADAIIILGSIDLRVADRGAQLYHEGRAPLIVCTGNRGRGTEGFFDTEGRMLARRLMELGVPEEKILVEEEATNTGENATYTRSLLEKEAIALTTAIIVTKPYMERRAYATFAKQWPELKTYITSPQLSYEGYFVDEEFKSATISMMVGDLERIHRYGTEGFQIPQDIPAKVQSAYERLIALGYDQYVPKT